MLGLCAADQAPQRRGGEIGLGFETHRLPRHHDELSVIVAGQPVLQAPQDFPDDLTGACWDVAVDGWRDENGGGFTGVFVEERPVGGGPRRDRRPFDAVQRPRCRGEPFPRDRAQQQRVHSGHRGARRVRRFDGDAAVGVPEQPDPQGLRADRVQ